MTDVLNTQDLILVTASGASPDIRDTQELVLLAEQRSVPRTIESRNTQELILIAHSTVHGCGSTAIYGGHFQDSNGNPLSGGKITVQISADVLTCDSKQVSAGVIVSATLDSNGSVPGDTLNLYPSSRLTSPVISNINNNSIVYYLMKVYSATGILSWQSKVSIPDVFTYNLDDVIPS